MRIFALATFLCLVASTAAWADCAWVLWEQYTIVNFEARPPIDKGKWKVFAALPTYTECNDVARKRAERHAEQLPEEVNVKDVKMDKLMGGGYLVRKTLKKPEYSSTSVEFRCFPDAIRP